MDSMSDLTRMQRPDMAPPLPVYWAEVNRQDRETQMDLETSVYLRCYLSEDLRAATSWGDLVGRLFTKGFRLKWERNRLNLVSAHSGIDICTCRHIGVGFSELFQRLGRPCVLAYTGWVIPAPIRH